MSKIRVLVVDDSAFMCRVISDAINQSPEMEAVGRAGNGQEALAQISNLRPDVVTMDVEMPAMDGLTALEQIMKTNPVPVIMVSSLTKQGTEQTLKALQLGAVDFVTKPNAGVPHNMTEFGEELKRKILVAAGARKKLQNLYRSADLKSTFRKTSADKKPLDLNAALNKLVLIGTSTGGPKALHQVIPNLPANLGAGVLVVQHMPAGFTRSLAERLDGVSQLRVKEAEHGEKVLPGCVYIAPGDFHVTVNAQISQVGRSLHLALNQDPPRSGHRPSVDVMLESVVDQFWSRMVCVIMTGMGSDGAKGLAMVKDRGGKTIAEEQSTCIVYGMPKSAVETGKVDKIIPLPDISAEIMRLLQAY
ncbi:MAG: chemotaxis response regulator protein-glutamate methylesterase [Syntrophomonas sp.]